MTRNPNLLLENLVDLRLPLSFIFNLKQLAFLVGWKKSKMTPLKEFFSCVFLIPRKITTWPDRACTFFRPTTLPKISYRQKNIFYGKRQSLVYSSAKVWNFPNFITFLLLKKNFFWLEKNVFFNVTFLWTVYGNFTTYSRQGKNHFFLLAKKSSSEENLFWYVFRNCECSIRILLHFS